MSKCAEDLFDVLELVADRFSNNLAINFMKNYRNLVEEDRQEEAEELMAFLRQGVRNK